MGPPTSTSVSHVRPRESTDEGQSVAESASTFGSPNETYLPPSPVSKLDKLRANIAKKIPSPLKKAWSSTITWVKGPRPPRIWKITPLFPAFQTLPLRLVDRYCPKRTNKFWLLMAFYFCWLLVFVTILHESAFSDEIPGYGAPVQLACADSLWADLNGCGLNGEECRPFSHFNLPFRCPASCITTEVLNPHAVGAQEIVYQPLVVGGPENSLNKSSAFYRGDSFICAAAIHAGYITNEAGGCGVLSLLGERSDYPSIRQNGIQSTGFDSNFPLSFGFLADGLAECKDLRWPLLAVSVIFTTLISLFTASPAVFFGSIWSGIFFHVALVSDQPSFFTYYDLVSIALGGFLPASFVMFVYFKYTISKTLNGLEAQFEKTILWLGGCWVGALNDYTFDKIPIQRLTPHDIKAQPGAITALVIICLVLFCIALGQAWAIRVEGKMPQYLALYAAFIFVLLMFVAVPNMNLRIHHYILAMLLLPGTFVQTRPALLFQGLLVGLFIDGIARWGFDSILQTADEIIGDGQTGSALPVIAAPVIHGLQNITFTWSTIAKGFDGISILINDVERFLGYKYDQQTNFTWERQAPPGSPEYFRFGFMDGSVSGDFTQAGIWHANGTWTKMKPGPS